MHGFTYYIVWESISWLSGDDVSSVAFKSCIVYEIHLQKKKQITVSQAPVTFFFAK